MTSKMQAAFFGGFFIITVQTLHFANAASTKVIDPKPIKYPGPVQDVSNRYGDSESFKKYNATVPDECKGKTFCLVKPPDYPQAHFNNMFKGYKPSKQPNLVLEDFGNRQGDPTETNGCETMVTVNDLTHQLNDEGDDLYGIRFIPKLRYEPLYHVKSKAGDWRTVVQAPDENYIQKIRLEECKDTHSRCFTVYPELGIETHCRQTVARWEVLVAGGPNGTEHIQADLPTCCSCVYKL